MKKTYTAVVGTRNRITIPHDCWANVKKGMNGGLVLKFENGDVRTWRGITGMTFDMSYRVAVPGFKRGTKFTLIPGNRSVKVLQ